MQGDLGYKAAHLFCAFLKVSRSNRVMPGGFSKICGIGQEVVGLESRRANKKLIPESPLCSSSPVRRWVLPPTLRRESRTS